jgi:hypothetical protein
MEKAMKLYVTPATEVVEVELEGQLLDASFEPIQFAPEQDA